MIRHTLARLLRRLADRLDPQYPLLPDVELVASLKREAAEWGMARDCEAIKREQEEAMDKIMGRAPHLTIVRGSGK